MKNDEVRFPRFMTSWDDGTSQDMKMAELLSKYNLPGIFYIPSNCELSEEEIKILSKSGFEIGGHTISHPVDLKELSSDEQLSEIMGNKEWLEYLIDKKIETFCYPRGRYNEITVNKLREAEIKWARTTVIGNINQPKDPFRVSTAVHVYPFRKEYQEKEWQQYAKELFKKTKEGENKVFHLWGHSWEIEKYKQWENLEDFFNFITNELK